jgi:alginate O-acetyltransferase complex protein AlgI
MLFNSYIFILLFLPATVIAFYWLKKYGNYTLSILLLVFASFAFYSWWNPAYLLLILGSIMCNYALGTVLTNLSINKKNRRWLLTLGVSCNLLVLCYYKYLLFFVGIISAVVDSPLSVNEIILPLAISFFTFQQIAYLVDAYRGESKHYGFLNYCLFVTFFPQLIAGPIVHHKEMMPQFIKTRDHSLALQNIAIGCIIFTIGLFKKVVIADSIAEISTPLFSVADNGGELTLIEAWLASLSYTLQLYFDFSGYADMAVGAARLFGITLPANFNSPYKSVSIIDFWRRWHITLSRFLRDYLYIALGGNRLGEIRRFQNLFITMLLGGLWHGAGWTFVVWGGLHGFYLVVNHLWRKLTGPWQMTNWGVYTIACQILTLICVIVGWVFFRAETLTGALSIIRGMLGLNGVVFPSKYLGRWGDNAVWLQDLGAQFYDMKFFTSLGDLWLVIALIIVTMTFPNTYQLLYKYNPVLESPGASKWAIPVGKTSGTICGIVLLYCLLNMNKTSEFLYFQF